MTGPDVVREHQPGPNQIDRKGSKMADENLDQHDAESNPLPYIVYGLKRSGRVVYVGRGSRRRMLTSAQERKADPFVIEAHCGQDEQIKREHIGPHPRLGE